MLVHLNIGSNQGDRRALIERAVALIVDILQPAEWRVSSPVETPPWGFSSPFPFMNIGMDLQLPQMAPEALLDALQAIERSISSMPHRNADGSYRDREIDIDIIAVDDVVYSSERLVLPHPRMRGRYFVLRPMVSLLPGWRHPATGLAVEDMLSECGDTENHACAE